MFGLITIGVLLFVLGLALLFLLYHLVDTYNNDILIGKGLVTYFSVEYPEPPKAYSTSIFGMEVMRCVSEPIEYTLTISIDNKKCKFVSDKVGEDVKVSDELRCEYYLGRFSKKLFITKVEK
jgi:hypothetical protein